MELKHIIIIGIIAIVLTIGGVEVINEVKESEMKSFDIVVINGEEYDTKTVEDITRDYINDDSVYIIRFKDGKKVYTKNYTLKMEGE